ncbi:MAG: MarR family transcriptional regulator [Bacteroidetes bacterium]|nr:MAG: MarR family transcriptional regulator [Bacteroidota bacterium]
MEVIMSIKQSNTAAAEVAELTFNLLAGCQEKEERFAAQLKITVSEFRCVRAFRGEKSLPVKTLVERVKLSGSRLTRILTTLEKNGYLQRSIDLHDRRSITVVLTKKGIDLSQRLEARYLQIHEEILSGIPREMHAPLIAGLRNMLGSLERWLHHSR